MKEEERGGGSELGSDLDPDPCKILCFRIRQSDADPLDPDLQHCFKVLLFICPVFCELRILVLGSRSI